MNSGLMRPSLPPALPSNTDINLRLLWQYPKWKGLPYSQGD